jgi:hypothetical protein
MVATMEANASAQVEVGDVDGVTFRRCAWRRDTYSSPPPESPVAPND